MTLFRSLTRGFRKIGVALGAGGARGVSHIGVLKALCEMDYRITCVAGSSIGSVIGAMYCFDPNPDSIEKKFVEFLENNKDKLDKLSVFNSLATNQPKRSAFQSAKNTLYRFFIGSTLTSKTNIVEGDLLKSVIDELIPDADISDSIVPFAVVAYDIVEAKEFVITSGNLRKAVLASSSIPGIFPPVVWDDKLLVDGGGICCVPVDAVRALGARKIVAIDVSPVKIENRQLDCGLEILMRAETGESEKLKKIELSKAWKIVVPHTDGVFWWGFEYYPRLIERGYTATFIAFSKKKNKFKTKYRGGQNE
jgi:NTE family protein